MTRRRSSRWAPPLLRHAPRTAPLRRLRWSSPVVVLPTSASFSSARKQAVQANQVGTQFPAGLCSRPFRSLASTLRARARSLESRSRPCPAWTPLQGCWRPAWSCWSSALHLDAAEKIETRLREQLESIKLQFETRLLEQSESIREQLAESTRRGAEHSQPAELCLDAATKKLETHLMEQLEPIRVQMTLIETSLQSLRDELAENPRMDSVNLQAAELRLEAAAGKIEARLREQYEASTLQMAVNSRLDVAAQKRESRVLEHRDPTEDRPQAADLPAALLFLPRLIQGKPVLFEMATGTFRIDRAMLPDEFSHTTGVGYRRSMCFDDKAGGSAQWGSTIEVTINDDAGVQVAPGTSQRPASASVHVEVTTAHADQPRPQVADLAAPISSVDPVLGPPSPDCRVTVHQAESLSIKPSQVPVTAAHQLNSQTAVAVVADGLPTASGLAPRTISEFEYEYGHASGSTHTSTDSARAQAGPCLSCCDEDAETDPLCHSMWLRGGHCWCGGCPGEPA